MAELDKNITLLIIARLNGTANHSELSELNKWLKSDPSNKEKYSEVKAIMRKKPISYSNEEIGLAFLKVNKIIASQKNNSIKEPVKLKRNFPYKTIVGIAASILLVIFLYPRVGEYLQNRNSVEIITKDCPMGQKLHLSLSEGTEVWLNSDSRITFPKLFVGDNRSVSLEGEAFFNVTKNKQKPFIVNTSNSTIEVLGTSFNVKNQNNNNITETTVVSGIVMVSSSLNNQSVSLLENQYASVDSSGDLFKKDNINKESIVDWKDNNLFFNNVQLSEVFQEIEPWFDIEIVVKDEALNQKRLRAKFSNPSLNQFLEYISSTMDVDYQVDGKKVTIQKK